MAPSPLCGVANKTFYFLFFLSFFSSSILLYEDLCWIWLFSYLCYFCGLSSYMHIDVMKIQMVFYSCTLILWRFRWFFTPAYAEWEGVSFWVKSHLPWSYTLFVCWDFLWLFILSWKVFAYFWYRDSWEPLTDFDRLWDNRSLKALLCILSQTNKKKHSFSLPKTQASRRANSGTNTGNGMWDRPGTGSTWILGLCLEMIVAVELHSITEVDSWYLT